MALSLIAVKTAKRLRRQTDVRWEGNPVMHDWSRHPDLYGWFDTLYLEKGGRSGELAGSTVRLKLDDIDALDHAIRHRELPVITRFPYFSDGLEFEDDLDFVLKARREIAAGFEIVLYASY